MQMPCMQRGRQPAKKKAGMFMRLWAWVASTCATEWQMDTHVCFLLEVDSGALLGTPGLVLLRGGFAVCCPEGGCIRNHIPQKKCNF